MEIQKRKKIAIIGSGISGLATASLLYPHHDIFVYEKNSYIGGHSRTIDVKTANGVIPVDTGFIVFNYRNYPLLTRLFEHLQVPVVKSDMSFGASIQNGWMEYGTQSLSNIFSQKRNLLRPAFWGMIVDILKFNSSAKQFLTAPPEVTLEQCLDKLCMGAWFRNYFLLAMGGAIWSMPVEKMLKFPACTFIRFFENHGLLTVNDQPQWYTVQGGSREYVRRLSAPFKKCIRLEAGVHKVLRSQAGVTVVDSQGKSEAFDEIVFACHADQALSMIDQPSPAERRVLGAFRYQPNRVVLHSDISFMPKRKSAWASWVYISELQKNKTPHMCLSYWMNNLQPLQTDQPFIVTLNPNREPRPDLIHDDYWFEHPVFDEVAIRSQAEIERIQGKDRFWFCGAYQRYGFHEDGLSSAVAIANRMGIHPPWK
ncbi:MAG: FAD-dependent oxidoreductase [Pseudomonadota bacterium]